MVNDEHKVNNQPDPSIKLPPIVLSGALDNTGGLDYDPQGVPYFKFPPFVTTTIASASAPAPAPPLVPFSAFKPHGIQILLDLEQPEVDGIGIRTVQLSVKHQPGGKDGKKKRKARKKLEVTFEKKVMWWEDWEEGESLRKGELLDINLPRIDRFSQGVADFQKNRRWTPTLQSVYDNFTQFAGLTGKTNQHVGKGFASSKKQAHQIEDDLMEADDDEAEFANAIASDSAEPAGHAAVSARHNTDETRIQELTDEYEAELERRELKLQAFLDDPELQIRIFFSSFYKNKGLFWSESKLNDGPILLRFFFKFFTRNGLMRDYDREFNKALKVVERAAIELPLTTKISKEIPDDFGKACVGIWDKQSTEIIEKERSKVLAERLGDKDTMESSHSDPPPPPPDPTSKNMNSNTLEDPFNTLSANAPDPSSWSPFEIPSQWGPTNSDTNIDGSPIPNPSQQSEFNAWGPQLESTGWSLTPPPFLMSLIGGPVSLPLTHEVKLVEKSTRRIAGVEENEYGKNRGVLSNMGKVSLAPWDSTPNSASQSRSHTGETPSSSILPPELHIIQPSPLSPTDDPTNQTITAYVSRSTCDMLRNAIGMGLYAVFVKVGLRDDAKQQLKKLQADSDVPINKKRKSHSNAPDSEFWYIELVYEITPSFWTESDEGFEEGSDDAGE